MSLEAEFDGCITLLESRLPARAFHDVILKDPALMLVADGKHFRKHNCGRIREVGSGDPRNDSPEGKQYPGNHSKTGHAQSLRMGGSAFA